MSLISNGHFRLVIKSNTTKDMKAKDSTDTKTGRREFWKHGIALGATAAGGPGLTGTWDT